MEKDNQTELIYLRIAPIDMYVIFYIIFSLIVAVP